MMMVSKVCWGFPKNRKKIVKTRVHQTKTLNISGRMTEFLNPLVYLTKFAKHLFCVGNCARSQGDSGNQNRLKIYGLMELTF